MAFIFTGTALTMGGFNAEITDINHGGVSRESVDSSHLGTAVNDGTAGFGSKTFLFGKLSDGGALSIEGNFDPSLTPPIDASEGTVVVTFPDSAGVWTFTGAMTDYSYTGSLEGKSTFSATIKCSGAVVIT